jgi:Flp pilus assembly pilin Flp
MRSCFTKFWNDERGQSTTEYILMLAIVVMIAMQFKKTFKSKIDELIGKVGGKVDQALDD